MNGITKIWRQTVIRTGYCIAHVRPDPITLCNKPTGHKEHPYCHQHVTQKLPPAPGLPQDVYFEWLKLRSAERMYEEDDE